MKSLPRTCWVVSDGRAGIENQALGIAEAIARKVPLEIMVKKLVPRKPWSAFSSNFLPSPFWAVKSVLDGKGASTSIKTPYPDLWIGCGRASLGLSAHMKRHRHSFVVQLQDPRMANDHFDFIIPPKHDQLEGPNVFATIGSPNRMDETRLAKDAEKLDAHLGTDFPSQKIAVLIGGNSKAYKLTEQSLLSIKQQLISLKGQGFGLMITTSRRTPTDAAASLKEELGTRGVFFWDNKPLETLVNPYFGMLGLADHILVTQESTNMITEAGFTGKPIHLLALEGGHPKFDRLHASLSERGITRPLSLPIESWSYAPLRETERAAQAVLDAYESVTA